MSEEEKQAIEWLIKRQEFMHSEPKCVTTLEESIDILLNLINKQQKEIEEFKGIKNGTTIIYKGKAKYVREDKINKYYISKDKIKEKIKEYKEKYYLYEEDNTVEVLEELLEE